MRTVQLILALFAIALFAAGCGSDDDSGDDSASTTPTQTQTTTTETTPTTSTPSGSVNPDSAPPERAKAFESCYEKQGQDIGGRNTPFTDTAFIVDIVVGDVYLFKDAATAKKLEPEIKDDNSGDDVTLKGDAVYVIDGIQPEEIAGKTRDAIEACL